MAGMSLRTGMSGGATLGTYTPMTPASANPPSGSGSTIGQQAYGVQGTGRQANYPMASVGSVGVGIAAIAALVYLWWSLPR